MFFFCCGEINELLLVIPLIFTFSYHHLTPTIFVSFCAHIFVAFLGNLTNTFLILSSRFLSTLNLVGTDPQTKAFHRWRLHFEIFWIDGKNIWKRIKESPLLNFRNDAPFNVKQKSERCRALCNFFTLTSSKSKLLSFSYHVWQRFCHVAPIMSLHFTLENAKLLRPRLFMNL